MQSSDAHKHKKMKMDPFRKAFANLCCDSFVSESDLEGNSFALLIPYLTEFFSQAEQFVNTYFDFDKVSKPTAVKRLLKKSQGLADALQQGFESLEKGSEDKILTKLLDLKKQGQSVCIPAGWASKSQGQSGHGMLCQFVHTGKSIECRVINTGAGLEYHQHFWKKADRTYAAAGQISML